LKLAKKKTTVPFQGTAEQEEKLKALIAKYKEVPGALMPVLQQAQGIYGYLPIEVQQMIAEGLNIPLAEVYGVVTFYSQFTLNPKGKYEISVCMGTACYVKGAQKVLDEFERILKIKPGEVTPDMKFSIDALRCVGACGLAPVVQVNGKVYGRVTPQQVQGIVDEYAKGE
jgi:NADH-quinone oxidoreductase E subunit